MKNFSIFDTMKTALIGKELKYVKLWKQINQPYNVLSKKNKSVTQKQFEGGNERFVKVTERTKTIGMHTVYETSKIVNIRVDYGDWDGGNTLVLELENGYYTNLEVDTIVQEIDKNVIMLKY